MSTKKRSDIYLKIGGISIVVIILIIASLAYAINSTNSRLSNMMTASSHGNTELYFLVAPNYNMSTVSQKTLQDNINFSYTIPESNLDFQINDTIDIMLYIINHEQSDMQYSVVAYQTQYDALNNSLNMTPLYYNVIEPITDNSSRQTLFHIKPAYLSNDTGFMIALFEGPIDNSTRLVNSTKVNAVVHR